MKRIIFLILTCFVVNANAQTYDTIFTNDKYKVTEFSDNLPETILINSDDDTIWVSYMEDLNFANCRIIALDNDLNITHNALINNAPSVANMVNYKINDKFYGIYYTDAFYKDTLQLRCFDRDGNIMVNKSLWTKNYEDTLWINRGIFHKRLSNNNFFLIANACYPSNPNINGSDAVKLFIFDTLGNIINSKTYFLKTKLNEMSVCEVGNHLIIEKFFFNNPWPIGDFSTYGISIINKETLEVNDSILRPDFYEVFPPNGEVVEWCPDHYRLGGINDSIFVGLIIFADKPNLHIINKNTKKIINKTSYLLEGGDINWPPSIDSTSAHPGYDYFGIGDYGKYSFINPDSIYTYYFAVRGATYLELLNFGISGNVNFTYRFTFSGVSLQLRGIKATQDGGVVVSAIGASANTLKRASWLIKFNPSGLIGLTNVETGERETIKVYPNPAKDYINVDIEATNFDKGEIELFDMQGKLVKRAKLNAKQGNRVDVSNLNAGAYTYNVSVNGKTVSGKVIVGK